MKGKKHSAEQIIKKLCEADATLTLWRNQYGGMKSEEAKRLKELEIENKRLKKLLAEAQLDKEILKQALEETSEPGAA